MRKETLFTLALVMGLMGAGAAFGQTTIIVSPSGDTTGINDWNAITQAFADATTAGPGSTVQLEAGTFYLHKGIVVWNFSGTFKGAGKTETTIQTAPGVAFDFDPADQKPIMLAFLYDSDPALRTLSISDMKLHITELTAEYYDRRPYTMNVAHGLMIMNPDVLGGDGASNVNASVENVDIEGTRDLPDVRGFWYGSPYDRKNNIFGGLQIWLGAGPGACSIRNCHISNADVGINTWTMLDGVISGNTVENGHYGFECNAGDSQVISGNTFLNYRYGLFLKNCNGFRIENNTVACPEPEYVYNAWLYGIATAGDCPDTKIIGNRVLRTAQADGTNTSYRYAIAIITSANSIISDNVAEGHRYAILLNRQNHDSVVSNNTASLLPRYEGDSALRAAISTGPSDGVSLIGNSISGKGRYGIWPYYGTNYVITRNTLSDCDFSTCGIIVDRGQGNSILRNDYVNIGSPGWAGCVLLLWSNDNLVFESGNFPRDTDAMMQVLDYGTNNRVVGHPADHVSDPGIGQEIQQVAAELDAMEEELTAAEAEQ